MELISERELPLVAYPGMNQVHQKELSYLNSLYSSIVSGESLEETDRKFEEFLRDVKEHFSYEEELMEKTHFFAYQCHKEEHERVLKELEGVFKRWRESRNREELRDYFEKVFKPWIKEHILTMDAVTAQWISRLLLGALP